MADVCQDLMAETAELDQLLEPLDETGWATPTPAPEWAVRDQVTHLAYFDEAALLSMTDPDRFRKQRDEQRETGDGIADRVALEYRGKPGRDVLAWLRRARADLVDTARSVDPSIRVPWYGPDMSAASSITARIMETWAHGQDVFDGLGVERAPTARLRHVAFLGVRAFANSYQTRGRPVPDVPVRVDLVAPGGAMWGFGPEGATDTVRGSALDFCLVVTQRRHLADTGLKVTGAVATEWMSIAQAFAGGPGAGRQPGQFLKQ
jgi:uncharacterized protein (TIGR03084 family)